MMGGEGRLAFRCLPTDYDRKARRFLDIDAVVAALGRAVNLRPPTEAERIFMTSHQGLRGLAKSSR
jgi:hypothetical protein